MIRWVVVVVVVVPAALCGRDPVWLARPARGWVRWRAAGVALCIRRRRRSVRAGREVASSLLSHR